MRTANIKRNTSETQIALKLNLDGQGSAKLETPLAFLNHMLTLMARHGFFDLEIKAAGDIEIDFHHLVEDIGITLGQALSQALGEKKGIRRYGTATVPMDESLATVVLDICSRPCFVMQGSLPKGKTGDFAPELLEEFLQTVNTPQQLAQQHTLIIIVQVRLQPGDELADALGAGLVGINHFVEFGSCL